MSEKTKAALDPETIKLVAEQLKKASKGEGFWSFLKQSATDESGNPSSSRTSMYIQLTMAVISFGFGVYFGIQNNTTLAITFVSSAFGLVSTAMGTNASAQKKSAVIAASKNEPKPKPQGDPQT